MESDNLVMWNIVDSRTNFVGQPVDDNCYICHCLQNVASPSDSVENYEISGRLSLEIQMFPLLLTQQEDSCRATEL